MELDFDKEIDALIRREGSARTITIGEFAGLHPDADEIAAFLENAVPASARAEMIGHFAGCDNCRRTLSNAIVLNGETISAATEGIVAPVEAAVPWYRRLFLFPNLAYVMGGLIMLFGGFIGLTVFNSYQNPASEVSHISRSEAPAAGAPTDVHEMLQNTNAASIPANASNASDVATNSVSNSSTANIPLATPAANTAANSGAKDQNFALDGVSAPQPQPALAQPPAKNEPKPADKLNEEAVSVTAEKERKREEQSLMAKSAPAPASTQMNRAGTSRDDRRETRASESDASKRKADELTANGRRVDPNRKQVSGKTFEFRQGAWYDTTYRGQGTVTVRRHTTDYRKLDGGLRGIAESFFGTVVTVWNGKAYRIQ